MATLSDFLTLLEGEYPGPKIRGKKFEPFLRDALKASPSHQFVNVWCWEDAPCYDGPDRGVDLVAEDINGGLWGIQSKLYDPDSSLTYTGLATWLATTGKEQWFRRLLVSTCPNLSRNAKKELLGDKKTQLLLGEDLFNLPVQWPDSLTSKAKIRKPLDLKDHQRDAIKAITNALKDGQDRVQTHMACGTGKTLVSLRVYEAQNNDLTVVLVPSISLMQQTIRSWTANATQSFTYLPVCSDVKVTEDKRRGEDDDFLEDDLTSLDSPATTDPDTISTFLKSKGQRVLFCTYQSSRILGDTAKANNTTFDLVIFDEAHRTTGPTDSLFAAALDDEKFPAVKRVFLTATPRIFTASDDGEETVASMDDIDRYGEVVYTLSFGEAVELGELADYEVVVVFVDDPELRELILNDRSLELDGLDRKIKGSTLTALEGTLQAISDFGLTKVISFHSRIKRATDFAAAVPVFDRWRKNPVNAQSVTVNGSMNAALRKKQIRWLEKNNEYPSILTNARCLTEGVDVPALDGIVFADPRKEQIDIVQAVGRVMRSDPHNRQKVGRIIIPLVIPPDERVDGEKAFSGSRFKPVWDVLQALKAHDFRLESSLNRFRGVSAIGPVDEEEFSEEVRLRVIGIDDMESFHLRVLKLTTSNFWWWFHGPLQQYLEREGTIKGMPEAFQEEFQGKKVKLYSWKNEQRTLYRRGQLSQDKIDVFEKTVNGWEWDENIAAFERNIGALTQFYEREGTSLAPKRTVEEFDGQEINLGSFVSNMRTDYKAKKLDHSRIERFKIFHDWKWENIQAHKKANRRLIGLRALREFENENGHVNVPRGYEVKINGELIKLGAFVSDQRRLWKQNKLSTEEQAELDAFETWQWSPLDDAFKKNLRVLEGYYVKAGSFVGIPRDAVEVVEGKKENVSETVTRLRTKKKNGVMSELEQETLIKAFNEDWLWEIPVDDVKEFRCSVIQEFITHNGHSFTKDNEIYMYEGDEHPVGKWAKGFRSAYQKGHIDERSFSFLDNLDGWWWNTNDGKWFRTLDLLRDYVETHGDTLVPMRLKVDWAGQKIALGDWVITQRTLFARGELSDERIKALTKTIPNWVWSLDDPFEKNLRVLEQHYAGGGHFFRIPTSAIEVIDGKEEKVSEIATRLRSKKRNGELSVSEQEALNKLKGWIWEPEKERERLHFEALQRFIQIEGHSFPKSTQVEKVERLEIYLGRWVRTQRYDFEKGTISPERFALLDSIPEWEWSRGENT